MPRSQGKSDSRAYECRETYLRWKVKGHKGRKEIIVTWEAVSKKIIKTTFNWLNEFRIPFNVYVCEGRDDGIPGIAAAYRLKSYHLAKNALVNQRLDAATKANNKLILIQATSDLMKMFPGGALRGGAFATTADVSKEVQQFDLSTPFQQMEGFEQLIDEEAMSTVGLSPGQLGQELANRPTSGGTLTILQQAGLGQDLKRESYRRFKSRNMKMRLARYKQFMPDGVNTYLRGTNQADRDAIADLVSWPEGFIDQNIIVEPVVNSETINVALTRQERMQVANGDPADVPADDDVRAGGRHAGSARVRRGADALCVRDRDCRLLRGVRREGPGRSRPGDCGGRGCWSNLSGGFGQGSGGYSEAHRGEATARRTRRSSRRRCWRCPARTSRSFRSWRPGRSSRRCWTFSCRSGTGWSCPCSDCRRGRSVTRLSSRREFTRTCGSACRPSASTRSKVEKGDNPYECRS